MNPTLELLGSHRSIRKFTDRPVPDSLLESILTAAQCASTSHYVQAYSVIRITRDQVRSDIARLAGGQVWVVKAPVFLVFCADLNRLEDACGLHGTAMESGWAEQLITATVDTALFAQNTMVAAESLGLGGLFVGGIRNDPETVCRLLEIPHNAYPVFGMCLGYPDQDPGKKPRLPLSGVLMTDTYSRDSFAPALSAYDARTAEYYAHRSANARQETWTRQMAEFMSREARPHIKAFLQSRGFFTR